jgi:DNA-binding MarR family transcriptional regulator
VKLYRAGEHTVSELEELFAVTRSTIYRAIARAGGRTALAPAGDTAT